MESFKYPYNRISRKEESRMNTDIALQQAAEVKAATGCRSPRSSREEYHVGERLRNNILHRSIILNMYLCMRTTIDLPDGLMQKAKSRMHETNQTFRSLVISGLEKLLEENPTSFRLRDASVGPSNATMLTSDEINQAIDAQRENQFIQ